MKRILPVLLLCCSALALQAQTECGGKETYPAHYCDCQYNQAKINSISQLNYLNFNDSLWFQGSSTIFTNAGMTAYLFSESDVQVDVYQRCTAKTTLFSFTVPKNQTRDMDAQALKDRMIAAGVDPSSQMAMRMVFYPVEEGAQCELYCYPYNTGPNSTAKDPLPVLVGMTYVSSHAYDVYELKAENIPASCALYTQWSEPSNLPCQLTITRGSATGEEVAVHDFLNASTYFRFDPNLLAEVRASGESLFMHYRHDASAAGRIITREAPVTTHVTDTTLCQGKGVEAYGVNYTAPGLVAYNREWVGTSLKVCEYKYNLILTEPEVQYDTLHVHVSELPMLYRGQYLIPSAGACDFDCTIHHDGECDERYLLHVVREYDDYVTACYGEAYEWHGTTYTQNGTYTKVLQNSYGCDSIVTLHLTMQTEIPVSEEDATICGGEGYDWNGEMYYETGDYEVRIQDTNGCDSIAILHLTVLPADDVVTNQEICHGDSWLWDETGEEYGITIVETAISSKNDKGNASTNANATTPFTINKDAITIDVSKGSIAANGAYYQINSRNTVTISSSQGNIRSIELTCTASGTSTYGPGNINVDNGSYSFSDKIGAWVGDAKEVVFTTSKYVRVSQIIVTYEDYSQEEGSVVIRKPNTHGCEVNYILNWKLVDCSVPDTALFSATACDSYVWHDTEYTSSGTYYYYTTTSSGRERVEILTLTLNKSVNYEQTISACNSYTWTDGKVYTESGTYTQNLQTVNGCDSIVTLHLTINKSIATEETITACDSYTWNGKTYTASGDYTYTTTATNGCDSIVTLHLTINKTQYVEETAAACDSYTWNGETYTESGDYTYTTTATNGCDSIVTLHLTVNKSISTEETITACDSYTWNGETYTTSGDYTYTTTAANGCDSVVTLHLTINKSISTEEIITACDSYTWTDGKEYTESGTYTQHLETVNGCDSIVTLHLTVNKSSVASDEYATICYGDSYTWNGKDYQSSGDYTVTLSNAAGCDSVVTLHLVVLPEAVADTLSAVVGADDFPYLWRGKEYVATGLYVDTEQYTTIDCDSAIHYLDLTVLSAGILDEQSLTLCETELPYPWYDQQLTTSGKYSYVEQYAGTDIDSIQHILNLTVIPTAYVTEYATACDSYTWNGKTYTENGDYTYTTTATNGCDSVVTLHLTINKSIATEETITACDSYTWNGETYTESGDYTYTTTATNGCDSVVTLHLTINKSISTEKTITACDSYTWNGETYTESGDYIYTTTATNGCDSIVTLHLTINKSIATEETIIACDSHTWNGKTYTASGDYTYTTTATNGCDSIVTLHLIINKSISTEETITACDSYTWNGQTYTASGDYTYTTTAKNGCDSVVTLHLTINKTISTEETITACDSYTWTDGKEYTESGTYTQSLQTVNGCDSIVTLHLTVNKSSVASDEYATICYGERYTWNGKDYQSSGDYTVTLSNAAGCDSVVTLHLVVLPEAVADTLSVVVGADDLPYLWRGKEYVATGLYVDIEQYATIDCDSAIHYLDLTVLSAGILDEQSLTLCETELPYLWYDQQLTTSGKYSYVEQYVGTDVDSIQHILNLTVIPTAYVTEYATACDSYVWNGQTYTESGDYTYNTTATNGCDSIVTLHLTINKSSVASDEYATICYGEHYTWNSKDYQSSGDYTITLSNAAGCDSVVTLHLVVLPEAVADTLSAVVVADDLPYLWRGKEYTLTGLYVDTEQYATIDCDSAIHYLDLTVLSAGILDEQSLTLCETELPYLWYDQSLATEGKYSYTEQYAGTDIDSVQHILHLIVNPIQYTEETITACDSYEWNGETYTESGDYTYTTIATTGCDSIVTLHLTILPTPRITKRAYVCYGDSYEWYGEWYDATGEYSTTLASTEGCDTIATLCLTVMPETVEDSEEVIVCASDLPYYWYGRKLTKVGVYTHAEPFAKVGCDSVIHTLTLDTYKMTLPNAVTLPIARAGEPINILVPTEEIQAHIDAQTWYAPNPIISWYVMQNAVWTEVSDEPVGEDVQDLILKYAVDTDCGKVESKNMKISVIPTAVDDITASDECTVRKVIMDDKVFIIRGNKMYSLMGVEVR